MHMQFTSKTNNLISCKEHRSSENSIHKFVVNFMEDEFIALVYFALIKTEYMAW